jgi:hypothetical protein
MATYKNKITGNVISGDDFDDLSYEEQSSYHKQDDSSGDFLTSMAIGAVTNSALLGGIIGGDITGGIVGDMLDGNLFD